MTTGLWTRATIGWIVAAALLPPAAVLVAEHGVPGLGRMAAAAGATLIWQLVFRIRFGVPLSPSWAVMAVTLAALAPADLSTWQLAVGASFGIVLAELVFGGWGRNLIAAPVAALAMLSLSHPGAMPPLLETSMLLAAGASALLLLLAGILSLTVVLPAAVAAVAVAVALGADPAALLTAGAAALVLVLLLGDPVAAPTEAGARILYGALAGALAALLAGGQPDAFAAVFATLLAQIFAPLFDHAALTLRRIGRKRRHG